MKFPIVDEIQAAEKRYYVSLQKYDQAVRATSAREIRAQLKADVCEAFAALKAAHEKLELDCPE